MAARQTRGSLLPCVALALAVSSTGAAPPVTPQRGWLAMQSRNFSLIGNGTEKDLRRVAQRLEQFRETIGLLFPRAVLAAPRPTLVVVFRNEKTFDPFRPLYEGKTRALAGFFARSQSANFIAVTAVSVEELGIIYHEYMHQIVDSTLVSTPLWFNEGLAEYYSSFAVTGGGRTAALGKVIPNHVLRLREQWIPLRELLAVRRDSPLYNEKDRAGVFYAESWALVHYLLLGEQQQHTGVTAEFVAQLVDGVDPEEASVRVLKMPLATLEKALRAYVARDVFPMQSARFTERVGAIEQLPAAPAPEAQVHAALGELLLAIERPADARAQLDMALALDPALPAAHAALGRLLFGSGDQAGARRHLAQAAAAPDAPWALQWDYAVLLLMAGNGSPAAADATAIEGALRRVIALNPTFAEAYGELAWLKNQDPARLDEAHTLVRKALDLAPGHERYRLLLASILFNRRDLTGARQVVEPLARRAATDEVRQSAARMLEGVRRFEEQPVQPASTAGTPEGSVLLLDLRKTRAGETRVGGYLTAIECGRDGITLVARAGGTSLRVHAPRFDAVDFISYRNDLQGAIECGARRPEDAVLLTYRAGETRHEAVAVEFLPPDYVPK